MAEAKKDVDMAMDAADASAPSDALLSIIREETKQAVGKHVQTLKRNLRKKLRVTAKPRH